MCKFAAGYRKGSWNEHHMPTLERLSAANRSIASVRVGEHRTESLSEDSPVRRKPWRLHRIRCRAFSTSTEFPGMNLIDLRTTMDGVQRTIFVRTEFPFSSVTSTPVLSADTLATGVSKCIRFEGTAELSGRINAWYIPAGGLTSFPRK